MAPCIGILTVSDSRSAGDAENISGPIMEEALRLLGVENFVHEIVPDEIAPIQAAILSMCGTCNAVFTTGGTGFSPRDVTPEATTPLLDRKADNLVELLRLKGSGHTPMSYLSRGVAGIRGNTLVVNLPGSPKAVLQGIETLAQLLPDILAALKGEECSHAG